MTHGSGGNPSVENYKLITTLAMDIISERWIHIYTSNNQR
jgi:hypothetical protein